MRKGAFVFGAGRIHHILSGRSRQRILMQALDMGFTAIDTAPAYGNGLVELEVGKALRGKSQVAVTTKFGIPVDLYGERGPGTFMLRRIATKVSPGYGEEYSRREFSPEAMRRSVEGSLRRLHRDHVDRLLLHEPLDELTEEAWATLDFEARKLKQEGKIIQWGMAGPLTKVPKLALASEYVQMPLAELVIASDLGCAGKAVYNVYSFYRMTHERATFPQFVTNLRQQNSHLDIILSTNSLRHLDQLKALW